MNRFLLLSSPFALALAYGCSSERSQSAYDACLQSETRTRVASAAPAPAAPDLVATDPDEVLASAKATLRTTMRTQVEQSRIRAVAMARCAALRPEAGDMFAERASGDAPSASDGDPGGASQVSTTNNQVAGVDEADFVKNDAKYIYVADGATFRIIEAWPAETAHQIANVPVPGNAKKLFVAGDRAVVYSAIGAPRWSPQGGECTYGYDGCVPAGDGTQTEISIFDIANRTSPRLVRSIHASSALVAARRIGTTIHTVLAQNAFSSAGRWASAAHVPEGADEDAINAVYRDLLQRNERQIETLAMGDVLPTWTDSAMPAPPPTVYRSAIADGAAMTTVLSIGVEDGSPMSLASVLSRAGWVYASDSSLYMAVPHEDFGGGWFQGRAEKQLTTVHQFAIGASPGGTRYVSTGVVEGAVLNSFAMDEDRGFLRVASTTGHVPDPTVQSTITVLANREGRLDTVGRLGGIAPTEDIRSVRFDGERGYVVTFKKTDPLFVFDLSDPLAPKVKGELKIPGFSTYMHMMDENHLLTIGYDAADQGSFAYFTGVLLQIFDVKNASDPRLVHKEVIGTRGSSSEALTNHLAFNYFAPKNLLALPMTVCEGGDPNGGYGNRMTFSGLMVYDTTVASGFALRGKVAHPSTSGASCDNWWTNASSEVQRSIVMDDYVFSISDSLVKVNRLTDLASDLGAIPLQAEPNVEPAITTD